jgi:AcrR family transcriptional regulator
MAAPTLSAKAAPPPDATRAGLLDAASEVFAEVGFRAATVRQICERAGANIAAVHYHFGDKEALYTEVLQRAYDRAVQKYPPDLGLTRDATVEQRLHAFVRAFLLRIFAEGPESHHGKLMAREMIEPTGALDRIVKDSMRPQAEALFGIVGELLGRGASAELCRLCGMSVVSQVLFYHHCRPVIRRMFPDMKFDAARIELLADHITRFSLAALTELSGGRRARK